MISIADQLRAIDPNTSMKPAAARRGNGALHGLLGHEIDAAVLDIATRYPGRNAYDLAMLIGIAGFTEHTIRGSMTRMMGRGQMIEVKRKWQEMGRFWPASMKAEALAWKEAIEAESRAGKILAILREGGSMCSRDIAKRMSIRPDSTIRVLRHLEAQGVVGSESGVGLRKNAIRWEVRK